MHHFYLSKNAGDRTAESLVGWGSLAFSSVDRRFLDAHKTQFVNDYKYSFFKKPRVMVDPTFLTPR
jgi:hypothetical protein